MSGSAQGGDDTLTATDSGIGSSATLFGDAEGMSESAHGGNDILNGGVGNDTLYGDARGYFLTSPGLITGGTDTLNGGAGDDQLWGGPNDDVFVFNVGSGNDVITISIRAIQLLAVWRRSTMSSTCKPTTLLIGTPYRPRSAMSLGMP
jgi:Ca2+-binding RTX toxin-like protein